MQKGIVATVATLVIVIAASAAVALAQVVPSKGTVVLPGRVAEAVQSAGLGYLIVSTGPMVSPGRRLYQRLTNCPFGKKVVGGGLHLTGSMVSHISESYPASDGSGWWVTGHNEADIDAMITFYAICINAS